MYAHNAADWAFWPSCKQIRNYSLIQTKSKTKTLYMLTMQLTDQRVNKQQTIPWFIHLMSQQSFWSCKIWHDLKKLSIHFLSLLLLYFRFKLWAICHFYLIYPLIQIRNIYSIDFIFILDIPIMQTILLIRDVDWSMAWVETKCWLLEPFVLCWRFLLGIWRIFPPSLPRWQMFV